MAEEKPSVSDKAEAASKPEPQDENQQQEPQPETAPSSSSAKSSAKPARGSRKRSAVSKSSAAKDKDGEATESDSNKPKSKASKTTKPKASAKKKVESDSSETEDEVEEDLDKKMEDIDPTVSARFGEVVWSKMTRYPYWPSLIVHPKHLGSVKRSMLLDNISAKYFVYFYASNDFALVPFKNIEAWDDDKYDYHSGYPKKDAKAPKRRQLLMEAINIAKDKVQKPLDARFQDIIDFEAAHKKPKKKLAKKTPVSTDSPSKRTPTKTTTAKSKKGAKKPGPKVGSKASKQEDEQPAEEETEEETPPLSKEQIQAKVANKKAPSKRDKKSTKQSATEIDSRRKKEIELTVPRQSVKSADIKEMTDEAAKNAVSPSSSNDKTEYKVGVLSSFVKRLLRLQPVETKEAAKEMVQLLTSLFEEKEMYRSDVERSGLGAVITTLRKSKNPTVAQTASAIRKHLMKVLVDDMASDKRPASEAPSNPTKKRKMEEKTETPKEPVQEKAVSVEKEAESTAQPMEVDEEVPTEKLEATSTEETQVVEEPMKDAETTPETKEEDAPTETKEAAPETKEEAAPEAKEEETKPTEKKEEEKAPETKEIAPVAKEEEAAMGEKALEEGKEANGKMELDANRKKIVDMLSAVLQPNGVEHEKLAKEIEANVFDRYKKSDEEYLSQSRMITFGLKANEKMRQRLFSGDLHALELVYAEDAFFQTT